MKKTIRISEEHFARLFVLCVDNKVNLRAFSNLLMNFDGFVLSYKETDIVSLVDLFNEITGLYVSEDTSYGNYNDAYWCGSAYFYIKFHTHKPLSYVLLKLPFDELIDLYNPYHEADYSKTLGYFINCEKRTTILKTLCKENKISMPRLSKDTLININTLKRYAKDDKNLYTGSFQNILIISKYFNITPNLFLEKE